MWRRRTAAFALLVALGLWWTGPALGVWCGHHGHGGAEAEAAVPAAGAHAHGHATSPDSGSRTPHGPCTCAGVCAVGCSLAIGAPVHVASPAILLPGAALVVDADEAPRPLRVQLLPPIRAPPERAA